MTTKEQVLNMLLQKKGSAISGENIAGALKITRASVNKIIAQLREDGIEIESKTRQGYTLTGTGMKLNWTVISSEMECTVDGEVLQCIDSTNTELKRRLLNGLRGPFALLSEEQTAGRGRQGKNFYSPMNTGLYMSLLLHPNAHVTDVVYITSKTAVAVARAIRKVTGIEAGIKWVNDIYIRNKKICGILVEAVSDFETGITGSLIIGIGVNVTTSCFPEEVVNAASLGNDIDRNRLAAAIAEEVIKEASALKDHSYLEDYRRWSIVLGKHIRYIQNGTEKEGTAISINDEGGLIVRNADGTDNVLQSGEISVRF